MNACSSRKLSVIASQLPSNIQLKSASFAASPSSPPVSLADGVDEFVSCALLTGVACGFEPSLSSPQPAARRARAARTSAMRRVIARRVAITRLERPMDDALLEELTDWLRIPSISTGDGDPADLRRAAEWVVERVRAAGGECEVVETAGNPLAVGELRASASTADAPTVLIYGHY